MTLRVTPEDLKAYAKQVGRASGDTGEVLRHCDRFADIPKDGGRGVIGDAVTMHHKVVPSVRSTLKHLHEVLEAASSELRRTAHYYEVTDRKVAAKVDATFPVVKRPVPVCE
jgi:uncharacterized protein YukE